MVDKSPWDTGAMQRITCVLQLKFEKALLSPPPSPPPHLPTHCKLETREKLQVLFLKIVCGVGGLLVWLCAKAKKVRTCHRTFVHDCTFLLI